MKANDTPQPFDPASIPPERRATAMIGREVRVVEWLPTPPAPPPPPRPTYHGSSGRIDGPEETQYRAELEALRKRHREQTE